MEKAQGGEDRQPKTRGGVRWVTWSEEETVRKQRLLLGGVVTVPGSGGGGGLGPETTDAKRLAEARCASVRTEISRERRQAGRCLRESGGWEVRAGHEDHGSWTLGGKEKSNGHRWVFFRGGVGKNARPSPRGSRPFRHRSLQESYCRGQSVLRRVWLYCL